MRFILLLIILFSACKSKSGQNNVRSKQEIQSNNSPQVINNITNNSETYLVYKVVDGDTFYCTDQFNQELKIRLIGIDTPETRNRFKKKKGYYGEEAKDYLTSLILNKEVKLEFDVDKFDQYNRVLAYAYTLDNTFINAELVKNGFARIMTIQPNSKYSDLFYNLQTEARENKTGLWAVEEY